MSLLRNLVEKRSIEQQLFGQLNASRGGSTSVSGVDALAHSAIFACTNLIADSVSTLPVDTFEKKNGQSVAIDPPSVLVNPSPFMSDVDWRRQRLMSWLLEGNCYAQIVSRQSKFGLPTELEILDPWTVKVKEDKNFQLEYWINGKKIDPDEILHWPGLLLPGSRIGVTPLTYAAKQVALGLNAEAYGQEYFINGVKANGVISVPGAQPPSAVQAQEIKERFIQSAQKAHEPVVLGGGATFNQITMAASDSQFLEAIKATGQDACRFYNMPPEMIGLDAGSSMTYSTIESRTRHFSKYTLNPWMVRQEKADTSLMPKGFAKVNRDAALAVDTSTRYNAHQTAVRTGFMSINEVRELEDLPPLKDGNEKILWPPYASGQVGQDEPIGQN